MTDSHSRPAQCKRFISLVLDADIIAAAFHFFGMESLEDAPSKHGFSDTMASRVAVVNKDTWHPQSGNFSISMF